MAHQIIYDGRWISTDTALGKEILKFEQPGYNPDAHPYPKMMYKAARTPNGKVMVFENRVDMGATIWKDGQLAKEQDRIRFFDQANQFTVHDESEHKNALNAGWRDHPSEALVHYEERELSIGDTTAERHHADSKMSPGAQAEAAAVDASTEFHVPEIPAKRRGRPRKVA